MASEKVKSSAEAIVENFDVEFPGKTITFGKTNKINVTVYPPGAIHIKRYTKLLYQVIQQTVSMELERDPNGKITKEGLKQALGVIIPMVVDDGWDLIKECVVGVNMNDPRLPHHVLPKILEAWAEISFLQEDSLNPWAQAIESLIMKTTKQKVSISAIISKFFKTEDTTAGQSSSTDSQDSPTTDGPSLNSGSESSESSDHSENTEAVGSTTQ